MSTKPPTAGLARSDAEPVTEDPGEVRRRAETAATPELGHRYVVAFGGDQEPMGPVQAQLLDVSGNGGLARGEMRPRCR